jgi:hypothetical protein
MRMPTFRLRELMLCIVVVALLGALWIQQDRATRREIASRKQYLRNSVILLEQIVEFQNERYVNLSLEFQKRAAETRPTNDQHTKIKAAQTSLSNARAALDQSEKAAEEVRFRLADEYP